MRALLPPAAALAAALAYRALWGEPRDLRLPAHELVLPGWPARLDGLRVALIADLHAGGPHVGPKRLDAVVAAVNAAAPDVVTLLGDYVDPTVTGGRRVSPVEVVRRLAGLEAPTVAVLGNHDWRHEGYAMAAALHDAPSIALLENDAVHLDLRGGLWVAGTADFSERRASPSLALRDVPRDEPVLLLSHNPDVFPLVPPRVALTLSGHTHGAQVDLPVLRRLVIPSRYGTRYKDGLVVEHGRRLFVSRGVGQSGAPVRLLAPPEVPVLTLRCAPCPS